jgi:hypothetical protein
MIRSQSLHSHRTSFYNRLLEITRRIFYTPFARNSCPKNTTAILNYYGLTVVITNYIMRQRCNYYDIVMAGKKQHLMMGTYVISKKKPHVMIPDMSY